MRGQWSHGGHATAQRAECHALGDVLGQLPQDALSAVLPSLGRLLLSALVESAPTTLSHVYYLVCDVAASDVGRLCYDALQVELSILQQKVSKIEGLENLQCLKKLWLNENKITKIEGLQNCVALTHLFLFSNQIPKIENLETLNNLEVLPALHLPAWLLYSSLRCSDCPTYRRLC